MFTFLKKVVDGPVERWFGKSRPTVGRRTASQRRPFRPTLEGLEERMVPSAAVLPAGSATTTSSGSQITNSLVDKGEPGGSATAASAAPVVTSATASGPTSNSLSSIQVTFSQSIVPSTFIAADPTLLGQNGAVPITSVTPVSGTNNTSFTIAFAELTAPGVYTLYVGTHAKNAAGIAVASYQTAFKIAAPPASTPPSSPPAITVSSPTHFTGTLLPGQFIISPNGEFTLKLQTQGNLVEYNTAGTALWSSGTNGQTVTQMVMQNNGNLVLENGSSTVWSSYTAGNPGAFLDLQNSGNLVIYSGTSSIWSATLTVQQTGVLLPGQSIPSPNGQYFLILQTDGNLVEYNSAGKVLWSSGTGGKKVTQMLMQSDGNLVLYNGSSPVWSSNTAGNPGAFLDVQNNGNIVISRGKVSIWNSDGAPVFVLTPGQSINSPNGEFTLKLLWDGNLVETNATGTILWSSGTAGQTVTQLIMQSDGNLVLYNGTSPVWNSGTAGHPGAYLNFLSDGNIEIYSGVTSLWSAGQSLQANGVLLPGQFIVSPNDEFVLTLQTDGNLVEYNLVGTTMTPTWWSATAGKTVTQLVMQSDGNLVLYNGSSPVWESNTAGNTGDYLSVQNTGDVELAVGATVIWSQ